MARKKWNENHCLNPEGQPTKASAVQILLDTWEEISSEVIECGGKFF
jgi:hypothetical protein